MRINELVGHFGANGPAPSRSARTTSRPRCPTSPSRSSNTSTRPASRDGSRSRRARLACDLTAQSPGTHTTSAPACPRAHRPQRRRACWQLVAGANAWWRRRLPCLGAGHHPGHHRRLHHVRPGHARPGAAAAHDPSVPLRKPHCARGQLCWRIRPDNPPGFLGEFLACRLRRFDDGPKNPATNRAGLQSTNTLPDNRATLALAPPSLAPAHRIKLPPSAALL